MNKYYIILCCYIFFFSSTAFPLKILFVVGHFPAPSQTFILNHMTGLKKRGHRIYIYSTHYDQYDDIHPDIIQYNLLNDCISKEQLPTIQCDIVLCQFGYLGKKIVESKQLQEWLSGKKVVTCFRGADITARVQHNPDLYMILFQKGDLFLPVCNFLKERLLAAGCPLEKTVVHYSAIDCSQFTFKKRCLPSDKEAIRFISVSRLVEKKGIEYLVRAMKKLINVYPQAQLTIVGDGPEKIKIQKLIRSCNLEKQITLVGWKNQQEVAQLLDASHIFVLPSITALNGDEEGIANALKEAMATGLVVITTNCAGNTELIQHGKTGYLVSQKNSHELYTMMRYVIEHPDEWESVLCQAREVIIKNFDVQANVKRLEELFLTLTK